VNLPELSFHARQRMAQRNITEEDVQRAWSRRSGQPVPSDTGRVWVFGYATGGRILKMAVTPDMKTITSVMWRDEA
jgi:Domain of unknown function (DUF4258)